MLTTLAANETARSTNFSTRDVGDVVEPTPDSHRRRVEGPALWSSLLSGTLRAQAFRQRDGRLCASLVGARPISRLAPVEHRALELAVAAHPYKTLCDALGMSPWAARGATLRALAALGLPTRAHAVWLGTALRNGATHELAVYRPRVANDDSLENALCLEITVEVTPRWRVPLTATERKIALAVAMGLTNKEIAIDRDVSVRTVANQIRALGAKLGAHGRLEIVQAMLA